MVVLYTSATNPRGEAAKQFLQERQIEFSVVDLDAQGGQDAERRLRQLLPDVVLPALTEVSGDREQLLLTGFENAAWESWLQARKI